MEHLFDGILKGKKVLVTGHTGFKGSWLCLLLLKLNAKVYGYALEPPTNPSLFEVAGIENKITSFINDIRNYTALLEVLQEVKPDVVIHLAAQALVRDSYKIPVETYEVNVLGTANLFEAIRNTPGVKAVVNVTTDKCYKNKEWIWGYRENDSLGGYDPYSNSKACSELVTNCYRDSFFNPNDYNQHAVALASARAGNVIGGGDWATDRLIPDFIRAIIKNEKVKIRSPHAIRPWQYVLDPLTGYLMLCVKLLTHGPDYAEAWNFGPDNQDNKTVEWIINEICKKWGAGASYSLENLNTLHEASYLKLDCTKARTRLNWKPNWNIYKALNKIVEWNKKYLDGENPDDICNAQIDEYFAELIPLAEINKAQLSS